MRRNPPPEELYARKWRIWAVAMVGLFMALIDITIVNITIPTLEDELDAPVDTVSWVLNAYNIVFAVVLVSMGRLADQFGRKRFFLIGLGIFTAGSLLCGIAGSIEQLIVFRAIQGLGAGVLAPLALALTTLIFPPKQRGLGLALLAVVANAAAAIGPPLGGVLLEVASWHWIFLVNVPIGVIGIVMAARVMPETYDLGAGRKVDLYGMVLLGGAVLALVAPVVGRFADRVPPRLIGIPALVGMAAGLFWFATVPTEPHYVEMLGPLILTGAAMGAAFPAINVGAMGSVRGNELGLGSGIVNMSRQLGFALGVAILVAVLERHGAPGSPQEARDAFADSFRVAAVFVLLAIPFALAMRRRPADAAPVASAAP